MKRDRGGSEGELRRRAEGRLTLEQAVSGEPSAEAAREMIHELRVHQVELEIQIEDLRNAQARIEESRARYSDLYDFAPIGCVTLNENGVIRQANLTAAKQLGIERRQLIHKPFQVHVAREDRERFHLHLQSVFRSNERQTCEVKLASHAQMGLYIQMDGISVWDSSRTTLCNLALTDISERERIEEELLKARCGVECTRSGSCALKTDCFLRNDAQETRRCSTEIRKDSLPAPSWPSQCHP